MKRKYILSLLAGLAPLALGFCANPAGGPASAPVTYNRIVIDTYYPASFFAPAANYIDLFGPMGDTSTVAGLGGFDLWNPGGTVTSTALAWDDGTAAARPLDSPWSGSGYAYVNYYPGSFKSGDVFYIRCRMLNKTDSMGYAIRALAAPATAASYSSADNSVSIPGTPTSDAAAPQGGNGIPLTFTTLPLNQAVGKNLAAGGVHWFKLVLP